MQLVGGQPGTHYDPGWWSRVHALFDEGFPGLPRKIVRAHGVSASWEEMTTPFVAFDGDRAVCHVGVLEHPMVVGGERLVAAGLHAVCTAADRRGQGLARQTLAAALEWVDARYVLSKLHTDLPDVYRPHGFVERPTYRWRASRRSERVEARPLRPEADPRDLDLLWRLLERRAPVSEACATAESGWLVVMDAVLSGRIDGGLWLLPGHDAIVGYDVKDGRATVTDVIAERLPSAAVVVGAAPVPVAGWAFSPDLFEAGAVQEPADMGLMVRGPWPGDDLGISPLWEH